MTIRSAAKAVIVQDHQVLLQCCFDDEFNLEYYELPGGGQNPQETMEEAVKRECLEETGFHVEIVRFLAIAEEIVTIESVKRNFPNHAHRIAHIFLCKLKNLPKEVPSEEDTHQVDVRWFPLDEVKHLCLRPSNLCDALVPLLESGEIGYLGTSIVDSYNV